MAPAALCIVPEWGQLFQQRHLLEAGIAVEVTLQVLACQSRRRHVKCHGIGLAHGVALGGRPGKIGRPKYPAGVVLVFAVLADAAGPERATFFLAFFAGTQRARAWDNQACPAKGRGMNHTAMVGMWEKRKMQ